MNVDIIREGLFTIQDGIDFVVAGLEGYQPPPDDDDPIPVPTWYYPHAGDNRGEAYQFFNEHYEKLWDTKIRRGEYEGPYFNISDAPLAHTYRVKKKMNKHGSWQGNAWLNNGTLKLKWEQIGTDSGKGLGKNTTSWRSVTDEEHFGQLHIIMWVPEIVDDQEAGWYDWNIEHLRYPANEHRGTSITPWYNEGFDSWVDTVLYGKRTAPDAPVGYVPPVGSWVGFYCAGYPGGSKIATDVLPYQITSEDYEGVV